MKTDIPSKFSVSELAAVLGESRDHVVRRMRKHHVPSETLGDGRNAKRYFRTVDLRACPKIWEDIIERAKLMGVHDFGNE